MKQPNLLRKAIGLLFAPLALAGLPAYAAPLQVEYYNWGYGTYTGTDENGNTFCFYIPTENECAFIKVETSQTEITIPEQVSVDLDMSGNYVTMNVSQIHIDSSEYWNGGAFSDPAFDNATNLTDITFPSNIEKVIYNVTNSSQYPKNLHFLSEEAPLEAEVHGFIGGYMTERFAIFAPESAVDAYKTVFNPEYNLVMAEGTDPLEALKLEIAGSKALQLVPNNESGINYTEYTGTDKDGNIFGFENPFNNYTNVTFRGAITQNASITVPDSVYMLNRDNLFIDKRPVERAIFDHNNAQETSFPGCSNLTDVYVSPMIKYAEWNGAFDTQVRNFHFSSAEVPEMSLNNEAAMRIKIYVPEDLFYTYEETLSDNYILMSEAPATPVYVNVATPGTLADEISNLVENLSTVRWIVVTGTPNELDLRILRRLPRLEILDLSQTTGLASVGGCNGLKYLREVILPEGLTSFDNSAFENCISLQTINIPDGVTAIGASAFSNTKSLEYLNLPATTTDIESSAFSSSGLMEINLENVEFISNGAFEHTNLKSVNLSKASIIGSNAFYYCIQLQEVTLSDDLECIEWATFSYCNIYGTLTIPDRVRRIDNYAFQSNYNIDTIVLGKNLSDMEGNAFESCRPKTIINHALFPSSSNGFNSTDLSDCTLYVPALTLNDYLLSDAWVNFTTIEPLAEDLTELTIDREYALTSDKGIADKANLNMAKADGNGYYTFGHLTVNRKNDLNLGNYSQQARFDGDYWNSYSNYIGSTIIPESVVTAENIEINMNIRKERWYFLSFPFDINVKDIVVDEDALWVVRKYSGEDRAALTENTWQNMTDETVLKAGEGYIFHCAVENRDNVTFKFKPAADGNAFFAKDIVTKELASYPSEFAHNASWNLVGNTFPAYMTIKGLEFEAPVTVWQDNTYFAYSPVDDEYVLDPFQAFFVQRQEIVGGDVISLNPQGRAHSREAAAQIVITDENGVARAPRINSDRALFNIFVKGENGTDRTRLVINEEASAAYESNRDASKFMSSEMNVPQIFVMNNNNRMAIDELPLGEGEFTLGTRFGAAGDYSISLETRNAEGYSVLLTDNTTGITTDITASEYAFTAEEGTDNNRFTIRLVAGVQTSVEDAVAEGVKISMNGNVLTVAAAEAVEITVTSADGMVVAIDNAANFSATLANGVYVVKAGNTVTKVIAGK